MSLDMSGKTMQKEGMSQITSALQVYDMQGDIWYKSVNLWLVFYGQDYWQRRWGNCNHLTISIDDSLDKSVGIKLFVKCYKKQKTRNKTQNTKKQKNKKTHGF